MVKNKGFRNDVFQELETHHNLTRSLSDKYPELFEVYQVTDGIAKILKKVIMYGFDASMDIILKTKSFTINTTVAQLEHRDLTPNAMEDVKHIFQTTVQMCAHSTVDGIFMDNRHISINPYWNDSVTLRLVTSLDDEGKTNYLNAGVLVNCIDQYSENILSSIRSKIYEAINH